jgi:hypothetical protein
MPFNSRLLCDAYEADHSTMRRLKQSADFAIRPSIRLLGAGRVALEGDGNFVNWAISSLRPFR